MRFNVARYMARARQLADAGVAKYGGNRSDYMDVARSMAMQEYKNQSVYSITPKNDIITVAGNMTVDEFMEHPHHTPAPLPADGTASPQPSDTKDDSYYEMYIKGVLATMKGRVSLSSIKDGANKSFTLWQHVILQSGAKNGWEQTLKYLQNTFPDLEDDLTDIIFAEYTGSGYSRKEHGVTEYENKLNTFVTQSGATGYQPLAYFLR